MNAYERAQREICERHVDAGGLPAELFEACQRRLRLDEKQMGARIGIVDCYREFILVRQPLSFRRAPSKQFLQRHVKTYILFSEGIDYRQFY